MEVFSSKGSQKNLKMSFTKKLPIIENFKGFECLKKKIPVHPNLSLSVNTQMRCLVYWLS